MKTHQDLGTHYPDPTPGPERRGWKRSAWSLAVVVVVVAVAAGIGITLISDGPTASTLPKGAPALNSAAPVPQWDRLVRSMVAFDAWLRLHPNPALVDQYMTADYAATNDAKNQIARFATGALRYDPAPTAPEVVAVDVVAASATDASVRVQFANTSRYRVLDDHNRVVLDTQAGAAKTVVWRLRYVNHRWLLAGQEAGR